MNSGRPRTLAIPLDFLAHIYADDPAVATRTHVRIDRVGVAADTVLEASLSAQGGQAIRITPAR